MLHIRSSPYRWAVWESISPDLLDDGILALTESPVDPQRLIAGGKRGEVHLTRDGGQHWQAAGAGLPRQRIRDVIASTHDPDRVLVVLSGKESSDAQSYVYRSDDFGATWRSIASNLPTESCNALAEDPQRDGLLFVGTDLGVYVSCNGGDHWESLCHGLPTCSVADLAVHGRDHALVAATHGLSIFLLDIAPIREEAERRSQAEASR